MAKNLKIKIKNTQLAKVAGLDKLKPKLSKDSEGEDKAKKLKEKAATPPPVPTEEEKPRRIKAKTKSAFGPKEEEEIKEESVIEETAIQEETTSAPEASEEVSEETAPLLFVEEEIAVIEEVPSVVEEPPVQEAPSPVSFTPPPKQEVKERVFPPKEKLGPTGRHIKDLLPAKKEKHKEEPRKEERKEKDKEESKAKPAPKKEGVKTPEEDEEWKKGKKVKEFKDLKPATTKKQVRQFDARDRLGLSESEEDRWRKKRPSKASKYVEESVVRPTEITVRLPITIKDLAVEMKLKASELIQKLFMQGIIVTLNDALDDETTVQYLGSEFGCAIHVDRKEADRIQITNQSIQQEIQASSPEDLHIRPPVVAFMGHVDHGKTSLIDAIRKSNRASLEAGAITQHMGAFRCQTAVGDITVLDTPGHEAFSAMRARGAEVTDIVVLVIAGDEGIRDQTAEAIQHAKAANVTIVVALNKCDKPNFNAENVYRQLAEQDLLPEAWGGKIITVNTSAVTGEGISDLLEMLALQAEVLELKANPSSRARGTVLESELHKGLGCVATILVQNGTLRRGDAIVFERLWGRVKTMQNEFGQPVEEVGPSTPVSITGLSGLPAAGDPFIVVKNEKEARDIAETRAVGMRQLALQQKKSVTLESIMSQENKGAKKILKLIVRGDVQGSVEALKTSLYKIRSDKAEVDIIAAGVGEVSESDVQLAAASNAVILGFHTQIESHADNYIKELGVTVRLHDIIYHAIEDVKSLMLGLLDKIEEEKDTGKAEVKAVFKASQFGMIAGCQVIDGTISRNHRIRVERGDKVIWKGSIASLKRVKEDVKEVKKGFECGILLEGYNAIEVGDILQAYEITYRTQEL